jgi:hypothetical protein
MYLFGGGAVVNGGILEGKVKKVGPTRTNS